ncbi:menaquinone biosynthesis methyltransferase-like protein [Halanaeroarchaeum sulfurireducens]|uniref:Menaquinone biosynthesis methyltransferase-like protein n=1 Tax=Halanaeroarchaeum sulfurireducens TaxID=1604004 RepID=A0A0F7P945_9EURY|nr:menaquinone biosynthesis methyltransferase-like protein [Halanaeroarchaeum sulfurireducens]ALG81117.1 menaquinone biosynthesis methyltransferase-like protein [Halanaeroarchaeum sulfurireducens]
MGIHTPFERWASSKTKPGHANSTSTSRKCTTGSIPSSGTRRCGRAPSPCSKSTPTTGSSTSDVARGSVPKGCSNTPRTSTDSIRANTSSRRREPNSETRRSPSREGTPSACRSTTTPSTSSGRRDPSSTGRTRYGPSRSFTGSSNRVGRCSSWDRTTRPGPSSSRSWMPSCSSTTSPKPSGCSRPRASTTCDTGRWGRTTWAI